MIARRRGTAGPYPSRALLFAFVFFAAAADVLAEVELVAHRAVIDIAQILGAAGQEIVFFADGEVLTVAAAAARGAGARGFAAYGNGLAWNRLPGAGTRGRAARSGFARATRARAALSRCGLAGAFARARFAGAFTRRGLALGTFTSGALARARGLACAAFLARAAGACARPLLRA